MISKNKMWLGRLIALQAHDFEFYPEVNFLIEADHDGTHLKTEHWQGKGRYMAGSH